VELLPENSVPVFTSTPNIRPQVGRLFQYQAQALDADGDTLTYALLPGAPTGLTVNPNTGLVTWTPTAAQLGNQAFTLRVLDGKGGETLQEVSLVVGVTDTNTAPTITSTPRTSTRQGNLYTYQVQATDPEGDRLTYSLVNPPSGMQIQNGLIAWQPTAA
jgi:large repetitive protein